MKPTEVRCWLENDPMGANVLDAPHYSPDVELRMNLTQFQVGAIRHKFFESIDPYSIDENGLNLMLTLDIRTQDGITELTRRGHEVLTRPPITHAVLNASVFREAFASLWVPGGIRIRDLMQAWVKMAANPRSHGRERPIWGGRHTVAFVACREVGDVSLPYDVYRCDIT